MKKKNKFILISIGAISLLSIMHCMINNTDEELEIKSQPIVERYHYTPENKFDFNETENAKEVTVDLLKFSIDVTDNGKVIKDSRYNKETITDKPGAAAKSLLMALSLPTEYKHPELSEISEEIIKTLKYSENNLNKSIIIVKYGKKPVLNSKEIALSKEILPKITGYTFDEILQREQSNPIEKFLFEKFGDALDQKETFIFTNHSIIYLDCSFNNSIPELISDGNKIQSSKFKTIKLGNLSSKLDNEYFNKMRTAIFYTNSKQFIESIYKSNNSVFEKARLSKEDVVKRFERALKRNGFEYSLEDKTIVRELKAISNLQERISAYTFNDLTSSNYQINLEAEIIGNKGTESISLPSISINNKNFTIIEITLK